ncbi:MAG: Glyoxalase, partial [uncultured Acetobacteraceae bacterium]
EPARPGARAHGDGLRRQPRFLVRPVRLPRALRPAGGGLRLHRARRVAGDARRVARPEPVGGGAHGAALRPAHQFRDRGRGRRTAPRRVGSGALAALHGSGNKDLPRRRGGRHCAPVPRAGSRRLPPPLLAEARRQTLRL